MRILIIRFSSIGDIIATSSLPRVLRNGIPEAKIDFLTSIEFFGLMSYNKHIDNVVVFNRKYSRFRDLKSLAISIKEKRYDLIIDAHNTLRTKIIKYYNKNTPFITFDKHRFKRFLLNNFKINLLKNIPLNVERHGSALKKLGLDYDQKGTEIFLPPLAKQKAKDILQEIKKDYVVIVSGAAWKSKQWSKSNYLELANSLVSLGYAVLSVGLQKDEIFKTDVKKSLYNFCGKLSLLESLSLMQDAKLVIGNDTGLIHGAEAIGKDVLMIVGPTGREYGMYPFRNKSQVVELDMWCRPCSSYGSKPCLRLSHACIKNISVEMVFDKAKNYLNKLGRKKTKEELKFDFIENSNSLKD